MSELNSEQPPSTLDKKVTRRDFLKYSLAGMATLAFGDLTKYQNPKESPFVPSKGPETPTQTEKFTIPELIHGVEVFGLQDKITSETQIESLYKHLDKQYAQKHKIVIENKVEQRKQFLDPEKRYLEVVVKQSAYESFLKRKSETQVDFVEWIQLHVDSMNLSLENAKPPSTAKAVLQRIVVIDDKLPNNFYDESQKTKLGEALDMQWVKKFNSKRPFDTDATWTIDEDYRVDTKSNTSQSYFWSFYHQDGKTIFRYPPSGKDIYLTYEFPEQKNSLSNKKDIWLDWGLIHEWSHRLLNLPDQYFFEFKDPNPSQFDQYSIRAGNSFVEPNLSPYLSTYLKHNLDVKHRGYYDNPPETSGHNIIDRPQEISIDCTDIYAQTLDIKVHKVKVEQSYVDGKRSFPNIPTQEVKGNHIVLNQDQFDNQVWTGANVWLLNTQFNNANPKGDQRQLFLPSAAFQMSKFAGLEKANYHIEFSGYNDPTKKTLYMEMVQDSDKKGFVGTQPNNYTHQYAQMKVEGTSTWFVWFL